MSRDLKRSSGTFRRNSLGNIACCCDCLSVYNTILSFVLSGLGSCGCLTTDTGSIEVEDGPGLNTADNATWDDTAAAWKFNLGTFDRLTWVPDDDCRGPEDSTDTLYATLFIQCDDPTDATGTKRAQIGYKNGAFPVNLGDCEGFIYQAFGITFDVAANNTITCPIAAGSGDGTLTVSLP